MKRQQATHERLIRSDTVEGLSDRGFGIVFAVFFSIVGLWPALGGAAPRLWASL